MLVETRIAGCSLPHLLNYGCQISSWELVTCLINHIKVAQQPDEGFTSAETFQPLGYECVTLSGCLSIMDRLSRHQYTRLSI